MESRVCWAAVWTAALLPCLGGDVGWMGEHYVQPFYSFGRVRRESCFFDCCRSFLRDGRHRWNCSRITITVLHYSIRRYPPAPHIISSFSMFVFPSLVDRPDFRKEWTRTSNTMRGIIPRRKLLPEEAYRDKEKGWAGSVSRRCRLPRG